MAGSVAGHPSIDQSFSQLVSGERCGAAASIKLAQVSCP
jgi:hypothetical protein